MAIPEFITSIPTNTSSYFTGTTQFINTTGFYNTTVPCTNDYCVSEDDYINMITAYVFPTPFEWVLIFLYLVIFCIGLLGNFLVCYAVWHNMEMRNVTNYFLVNLSVADFLVLLLCLPLTVLDDVTETWFIGTAMCKFIKYLQSVSVLVSVSTLTAISMERWHAICHPLTSRSSDTRTRVIISITWAIGTSISMPELIVLSTYPRISGNRTILLTSCKSVWDLQAAYQLMLAIVMYFIPFIMISFFYHQMARKLWSTRVPSETTTYSVRRTDSRPWTPMDSQLQSRRKAAKMLMAVVAIFGICYLPVHLLNILRYSGAMKLLQGDRWAGTVALISHWLCFFNSSINPVVYYYMSTKFRLEFRLAMRRLCRCGRPRKDYRDTTYRYTSRLSNSETANCIVRNATTKA